METGGARLQVRLLGPVDVTVSGAPRAVSGLRRKAVLATLALHPGQIVSVDRLIDVVWGGKSPATAANTLQHHVSYLRGVLGVRSAIVSRSPGYILEIGTEATDVEVAERLIRLATQSADRAQRAATLQAALALWRGNALSDAAGLPWLDEQAEYLAHLRLEAVRALVDARLALGDHGQLVLELERLAQQHPFDEQIHAQLMLALYRTGRQGDALATFRRLRQTLNEDLGIDPAPAVCDLETAILRQEATVDPPLTIATPPAPAVTVVPAQLPPALPAFVGREAELATMDGLLGGEKPLATRPTSVVISALSGTAGVGKTALVVHWGHRVVAHFPDGQLYVNLRGFDPGGSIMDPAVALRGFLHALGVPAAQLPSDTDGLTSLYRSVLDGRRVLVVLDNARDVDQVRPLLPGSPGCLVVVTSRDRLTPLIVTEGAYLLVLDLMTPAAAWSLLEHRLGARRVAREPEVVEEIITRCARLPLALAIVGARAATHPGCSLATMAAELRDAANALDAFHGGDPATDVRAAFTVSYRTLSAEAATLFRLLGLHPGPDIAPPAAASLAGISGTQARQLLAQLTRANLITEHVPGRFMFHDLLGSFAASLASTVDAPAGCAAAQRRLLDHYLHTAHAADLVLHPHFSRIDVPPRQPGVAPEAIPGRPEATAWFTAELSVLLALVPHAARSGFEAQAWKLAWSISGFLDRRGRWQDWYTIQSTALDAALRIDDPVGQGHAHRDLGRVWSRLGRHGEAIDHLRRALVLFGAAGDHAGQAHAHLNLGQVTERQGHHRRALEQSRQALILFQRADSLAGQAYTLNAVGWQQTLLGDHEQALASCRDALDLLQKVGDVQGAADAWDSLGYAHHQLAHHRRAIACYQNALSLLDQVRDDYAEACTLVNIGETYRAVHDPRATHAAWSRALSILDRLGHSDATQLRADLDRLGGSGF